jgi:transposase
LPDLGEKEELHGVSQRRACQTLDVDRSSVRYRSRRPVRKYIERGLEPPRYAPRQPRARRLEPFEAYLRQRVAAYPVRNRSVRAPCAPGRKAFS